jgi:hypothetical protein
MCQTREQGPVIERRHCVNFFSNLNIVNGNFTKCKSGNQVFDVVSYQANTRDKQPGQMKRHRKQVRNQLAANLNISHLSEHTCFHLHQEACGDKKEVHQE